MLWHVLSIQLYLLVVLLVDSFKKIVLVDGLGYEAVPLYETKELLDLMGLHSSPGIACRNQLKAVQLANVRLVVKVIRNANLGQASLNGILLARLWAKEHYPVSSAEVNDVRPLNAGRHGMNHLVIPYVKTSMGVSLLVWNELAVQVLVVAPYQNIPRLCNLHYALNVVASNIVWIWVIDQNWDAVKKPEDLDFSKPGQKLRPYVVDVVLHQ